MLKTLADGFIKNSRLLDVLYKLQMVPIPVAIGYASANMTSHLMGDPVYHLSGGLANLAGRVADFISTYRGFRKVPEMGNKVTAEYGDAFKRYGLKIPEIKMVETNPTLPANLPRRTLIKRFVLEVPLTTAASAFYPPVGYALSTMSFEVALSNIYQASGYRINGLRDELDHSLGKLVRENIPKDDE